MSEAASGAGSYPPEYLFVTPAPTPEQLQVLVQVLRPAEVLSYEPLTYQLGQDAVGRTRCTLTLHAPDREAVAALRQRVIAYCRAQGWKAIVV